MQGDYKDSNLTEEELEEIQYKKDLDSWEEFEEEEQKKMGFTL